MELLTTATDKQKEQIQSLLDIYDEKDEILYEIIGLIHEKYSIKDIIQDLTKKRFSWKSHYYKTFHKNREVQDAQLENPPEIREGEIECPKCKTKKTILVEMQIRRADEGFTYEIHCFNPTCKFVKRTDNF
jgi:DNA-directed RNA polymerase subunit M/transcription elongation factor TFIIS